MKMGHVSTFLLGIQDIFLLKTIYKDTFTLQNTDQTALRTIGKLYNLIVLLTTKRFNLFKFIVL
jgi:hypothetical protein